MTLGTLLGIPEGHEGRALRLIALVFVVSAAFSLLKSAQAGIFLAAYPVRFLPWAFAASAVGLALLSAGNVALGARLGPVRLTSLTLLGSAAAMGTLWLLLLTQVPAVPFLVYVTIEICIGLSLIGLWSVVSEGTNTRSAKRLLPLAGVGASAAYALGGVAVPALVPLTGERGLLLLAPALLLLGRLVIRWLVKRDLGRATRGKTTVSPLEGWRQGLAFVVETPLMRLVASLTLLLLVSEQLMDLLLMSEARAALGSGERIASFFGLFYGLTSALSLGFQLLLSGRLMERMGTTRVLAVAPGFAFLLALAVLLAPGLATAVLLRGGYRVLKQALWSASLVQIQTPLPVLRRAQARSLIRGIIGPAGYATCALVLALLPGALSPRWLGAALLLCTGTLVVLVVTRLRPAYRRVLQESIDARRLVLSAPGAAPQVDTSAMQLLSRDLDSDNTGRARLAVELLGDAADTAACESLVVATEHRSGRVRASALKQLVRLGRAPSRLASRLLTRDPAVEVRRTCARTLLQARRPATRPALLLGATDVDPEVRAWCQLALIELDGGGDLRPLLTDSSSSMRAAALSVIGADTPPELIRPLLDDHFPAVRTAAIAAIVRLSSTELAPDLLRASANPRLIPALTASLPRCSEEMIEALVGQLARIPARALRNLAIAITHARGRPPALLMRLLTHPHEGVREEITRALCRALRTPRLSFRLTAVSPQIAAEITAEIQRAWQLVALLGGLAHDDGQPDWIIDPPFDRLALEIDLRFATITRRLLCLLALSGVRDLIGALEMGLRPRGVRGYHIKVAELLDVALSRRRSRAIVPLFTPSTLRERFAAGRALDRIHIEPFNDPLACLVDLRDVHLLRCAMVIYGQRFAERYPEAWEPDMIPFYQRMMFLRSVPLFSSLAGDDLRSLAAVLDEDSFSAGTTILAKGDPGDDLYLIVRGQVKICDGDMELALLGDQEFFGELSVLDHQPRAADAITTQDSELLRLRGADLGELMTNRPAIGEEITVVLAGRLRTTLQKLRGAQSAQQASR